MYLPVVFTSLWSAVRHRSLTVALLANPNLHLSGLASISKGDMLSTAQSEIAKKAILPFIKILRDSDTKVVLSKSLQQMEEANLQFPLAAKPDRGYRGAGVDKVSNSEQLQKYIESLPDNCYFLLQKLATYKEEAGVFYVRYPNQKYGEVISVGLKTNPTLLGDGKHTVSELIDADSRRYKLRNIYREKHSARLDDILAKGEKLELLFSSSHSEGSVFTNANKHNTVELSRQIDKIMRGFDQLYYGRLDVKFRDIKALEQGEDLEVIEINGANSEPLDIWDKDTRFFHAINTLINQYNILYKIGAQNRARGHIPPRFIELIRALIRDRKLIVAYPKTR